MTTESREVDGLARNPAKAPARHEFVTLAGQRYACIRDVDHLAPFLMSIVSDSDAAQDDPNVGRVDLHGVQLASATTFRSNESGP